MLRSWLVMAVFILPSLAVADEPKKVKTLKVVAHAPGESLMYEIKADGSVAIDWPAVEAIATNNGDQAIRPIAKVMLAIRDGKAGSMQKRTDGKTQ